jgi:hypothetical protein
VARLFSWSRHGCSLRGCGPDIARTPHDTRP